MKQYVFSETDDGKRTIHFESESTDVKQAEKECVAWVKKNCIERSDHWEMPNGEWVGLTN